MAGPSDVVAEALEANRIKETLLSQHARTLGRMAAQIVDAVRAGRTIHVLGEGPRAALATYLAEVLFRADLPARPLGPSDEPEALLRTINAFVQVGDVVLLLAHEPRPGLDRAVLRARAKGSSCLGLLAEPAAPLAVHCDINVGIATSRPLVAAEVLLAAGHLLVGLVADGASRGGSASAGAAIAPRPVAVPAPAPATPPRPAGVRSSSNDAAPPLPGTVGPPPPRPVAAPVATASTPDSSIGFVSVPSAIGSRVSDMGVIDEDPLASGDDLDEDTTDEAMLLAEAVEGAAAPPTDPRAMKTRRRTERTDPPVSVPPPSRPERAPAPTGRTPVAPGLLRFRCGGCEEPIVVEERHAGRRGQCPHCRSEFVIPKPPTIDMTATQRATVVGKQRPVTASNTGPGAVTESGPSSGATSGVGGKKDPGASGPNAAPAAMSKAERRRASRIVVKDGLVRFAKDEFPAAGGAYVEPHVLEDLSLTGMRFIGRSKDYEVGQVLCFSLDIPAFPEPVRIKGEVRRIMRMKNGGGFGAGVRFVQYHGDAEAKVRRLLDSAQLRGVRRR